MEVLLKISDPMDLDSLFNSFDFVNHLSNP